MGEEVQTLHDLVRELEVGGGKGGGGGWGSAS